MAEVRGLTRTSALAALAIATLTACGTSSTDTAAESRRGLALQPVATGLDAPLHAVSPPGDTLRLFVVEQPGRVRIVRSDSLLPRPWLDIAAHVGSGGERGLLSLAFAPDFAVSGRFYVNYTEPDGTTRISRFHADPAADTADAGSEEVLLRLDQPYANHNGGHILFGRDGYLYVGMGDGGAAADPHGNAQDRGVLLGKILRLDVSGASGYSVPPDNPFSVGTAGTVGTERPEIWAWGVRNPWRMAFDTATGTLWVADVGQSKWEEINAVPDTARGLDYGWRRMEGRHCFLVAGCSSAGRVLPVHEYGHDIGCSITGGVVYRGAAIPGLAGHYLFSDWCGGWIRSLAPGTHALVDWGLSAGAVTSFGTDGRGEVYVVAGSGNLFRIVPAR